MATAPQQARAQVSDEILGASAGIVAGAWWSLSIAAARARHGEVLFSRADALPTLLPMVGVGLIGGLATGTWGDDRLPEALGWGLVGWVSGFGLGYIVGDEIWEDEAGKWAGAVIGAGAGLAIGAVIGGLTGHDGQAIFDGSTALFRVQHSFRVGR